MANDTATRLLARVKELREARGLSQEAFAGSLDILQTAAALVLAADSLHSFDGHQRQLAKACGLKLWELLNLDDETPAALAEDPAPNEFRRPAGKLPRPAPGSKSRKKTR